MIDGNYRNDNSRPSYIVVSDTDFCGIGLGSNLGEAMVVCKCILPLRHRGNLNIRPASSHFEKLLEGETRWDSSDHPQGVLPQNSSKADPNLAQG
ncbi:hypothetical protein TNCV_2146761 [Trichonephila clavipes]|uniref:Uncharacterized protein n=1 Tax=Trichonephila clavipes TaxID=2585209 RepID=A0A8X6T6Q4_TRICX|nr:hypothetical protein TNCV_2146761 [Trichonephila clavipes]